MATVIHELQRISGKSPIDLEQAADRAFLGAVLDSEPNRLDEDFRSTFYQHTAGHALFTIDCCRTCRRGDLMRDAEGRWIEGRSLNWEHIPPREAVIAERIDRLPEDAQLLLRAASVEGDEFTAEVTARVLGLDRAEVLRQLSGRLGEEHKLVRGYRVTWLEPDRRSLSRYRFRHALFHDYLYQRLDAVERSASAPVDGRGVGRIAGTQSNPDRRTTGAPL